MKCSRMCSRLLGLQPDEILTLCRYINTTRLIPGESRHKSKNKLLERERRSTVLSDIALALRVLGEMMRSTSQVAYASLARLILELQQEVHHGSQRE